MAIPNAISIKETSSAVVSSFSIRLAEYSIVVFPRVEIEILTNASQLID